MRLFQETGMDQVSMREIARESDMPIGSVYQYFPNKQAIVRQIWENYTASINGLLESEFEAIRDQPSAAAMQGMVDRVVSKMAEYHINNPAFPEILRCVDASPDLRQLNLQDTMQAAERIQAMILRVNPQVDEAALKNYAIIASEATSSTIRLGQQMPADQRDQLYESLKSFLLMSYQSISGVSETTLE